jgi:hypothetical protein
MPFIHWQCAVFVYLNRTQIHVTIGSQWIEQLEQGAQNRYFAHLIDLLAV